MHSAQQLTQEGNTDSFTLSQRQKKTYEARTEWFNKQH